ncbi:MAG: Type pantothenate kinase [Bacteroidota bacterium]
MNVVVDIGNSRVKVGYFEGRRLVDATVHLHEDYPREVLESAPWQAYSPRAEYLGLAHVGNDALYRATLHLRSIQPGLQLRAIDQHTPTPFGNRYQTPGSLGMDRICATVAGFERAGTGPVLVINAGTALTFDYVDEANDYLGGAISPGLQTRFRALHDYTAALPLLSLEGRLQWVGDSTDTCIRSGVVHGMVLEMEGFITRYARLSRKPLQVYLTGGDAGFLGNHVKNITFVDSNLVLYGINTLIIDHA